jgi:putative transposase
MEVDKHTSEKIFTILRSHENGMASKDVCRENGIKGSTLKQWKRLYHGLDIAGIDSVRKVVAQNTELKKQNEKLSADNFVLRRIISKKGWGLAFKENLLNHS